MILDQLNSELLRVETNCKLLNILAPDTEVIQVSYTVQVGSLEGEMLLVIPYFSLEPFKDRLREDGLRVADSKKQGNWGKHLEKEVSNMEISVAATWGELTLTIRELLGLEAGDIIGFDYDEKAPIKVMAGQSTKYRAQPGLRDGKKAIRLVQQQSFGV